MREEEARSPAARVILPCPTCGRSVQVLGRMRRVLCGCGQVLMEIGSEGGPLAPARSAKPG